jgi:hypothetical protein
MTTRRNTPTDLKRGQGGSEAGGQHQGLRHPADDRNVQQRLNEVGLDDQGDALEDELRDRRSRGVPGVDDSSRERSRRH